MNWLNNPLFKEEVEDILDMYAEYDNDHRDVLYFGWLEPHEIECKLSKSYW